MSECPIYRLPLYGGLVFARECASAAKMRGVSQTVRLFCNLDIAIFICKSLSEYFLTLVYFPSWWYSKESRIELAAFRGESIWKKAAASVHLSVNMGSILYLQAWLPWPGGWHDSGSLPILGQIWSDLAGVQVSDGQSPVPVYYPIAVVCCCLTGTAKHLKLLPDQSKPQP